MDIGISTWSIPWAVGVKNYPQPEVPVSAEALMRRATELDVKVVQFADNLPVDQLPDSQLDLIAQRAAEWELVVELGTRTLDVPHLRRYVEVAARIGSRIVRTVLSGSLLGREEVHGAKNSLFELLPDLERHEIAIALENNEAFSAREFAEIVHAIDSPLVGICLDTANSLGRTETIESVVHELAGEAIMLHAKDYEIQRIDTRMGYTIEGRPLGDGRVDFEFVLGKLRESRRDGISAIIEHWPPFDGDIESTISREDEWLTTSVVALRALL